MILHLSDKPYFYIIIGLTLLCSFIGFSNREFFDKNKFSPYAISRNPKEWHRFITSGFLHADFMHLFLNMYVFFSFGNYLNSIYKIYFDGKGDLLFLALYLTGIAAANIPTFLKEKNNYAYESIGASGSVAAILYATILIEPQSTISMMGIQMPAIVFGAIYLAVEFFLSRRDTGRINHDAHFWGALYGFVFTGIFKPELFLNFIEKIKIMFS